MSDLAAWQAAFLGALQARARDEQRMQSLIAEPAQRLSIYADCSRETHIQALRLSFPHCLQLLGEVCFNGLVTDYLEAYASNESNLDNLGRQLPDFIPRWLAQQQIESLDYLPQLAQLDDLIQQAYAAADGDSFDLATYTSLSAEAQLQVSFTLTPSIRLMRADWPLKRLIDWHQQGAEGELTLPQQSSYYLIWRRQWSPTIEELSHEQYHLFTTMQAGQTFAKLADSEWRLTLPSIPEWIQKGWITGFTLLKPAPGH